jgi:hypothetical protein
MQKLVPHMSSLTYHCTAQDSQSELSADLCISLLQAVLQKAPNVHEPSGSPKRFNASASGGRAGKFRLRVRAGLGEQRAPENSKSGGEGRLPLQPQEESNGKSSS